MKVYGEVNFQQNFMRDAVVPLTSFFPANPVAGQLVFANKILYICLEIVEGLPHWAPLTKQITTHTHVQSTGSSTWTINHNLNTSSLSITVYDATNKMVMPDEVEIVNPSQVVISFAANATGSAVLLSGNADGQPAPTYAYEFFQTEPASSWVIPHGLGRHPVVRVFIGNQEVQPASITFDTMNQLTLTFNQAYVGQAKLI